MRRHSAFQLLGCTIFTALALDVVPAQAQAKPRSVPQEVNSCHA